MSQHLELRDVFIDVPTSHLKFLKVIMGLLLLGIVHKGPLEVFLKYYPGGPSIEFIWVILYLVQPIVVSLDPASSLLPSNAPHEVGALPIRVLSYG